jgi:hypothetical protein
MREMPAKPACCAGYQNILARDIPDPLRHFPTPFLIAIRRLRPAIVTPALNLSSTAF